MARHSTIPLTELLAGLCIFVCLWVSTLLSCSSSGGGGGGGAEEAEEGATATLFTSPDEIRVLTGATTLDPRNLFSTAGGPVLFFDAASDFVIFLDLDGTPSIFTTRDELAAETGTSSLELGPMDQVEGGAFDGEVLCADAVSGLLVRIEVNGLPHVHATESQVLAATGETSAAIRLPRSLAPGQVIAQDLVSKHILRFDNAGDAEVFVDDSDLALAAGVIEDAAEIAGWARGPVSGSQFTSFSSTTAIVRIRTSGMVDRLIDPVIFDGLFPTFTDISIVKLATDAISGTDDLYILVADEGRGQGIAVASPDGAQVRQFTNFNDFPMTAGFSDFFDFGFVTVGRDRFFYAMDGIGASVYTLDADGIPEEVSGPGHLLDATGAPGVNLGPGAPIDGVGLVVLEPESDSFVLLQ